VVVPVYRPLTDPAERLSLEQTLETLTDYPVYLVGPVSLKAYFDQLRQSLNSRLQNITFADQYFASIEGYNDLLLSRKFYQAFDSFEYLLIVQTDALVLSNALEFWCGKQYSYIGAPWFEGYTTPTLPLTLKSVGNGGFSLRRVPDFLKVLSRPRIFKNVLMQSWPGSVISNVYRFLKDYHSFVYLDTHVNIDVNEDLFWGLFVPAHCPFFRVPVATEALAFAFEAHPDFLYKLNQHSLPFGCHAWQRYQPEFWIQATQEKQLSLSVKLSRLYSDQFSQPPSYEA
jgi:hypothetical protein